MVLLAALVVAAIFVIGWPLLHSAAADDVVAPPTAAADERVRLREERDQALEALRDLELDRRTGKIADEDFAVLDAELRAARGGGDRGAGAARVESVAVARPFTIAHISDLHCGSPYFVPNLMDRAIIEVNDLEPDVVIVSGDLTTFGFRQEYVQARAYLDRIECPDMIVVPGQPRLAQRRLRPLRGAVRRPPAGAAQGRRLHAGDRLVRARPRPRRGRPRRATRGSARSSPSPRGCGSSSCTTTCCRSRARAASATSCTTPATRSRCWRPAAAGWCCPATSTCRTRGGSRTCSSSTPAPSRPCAPRGKGRPCYNIVEVHDDRVDVLVRVPVPRARPDPRVLPHDARSP